MSEEDLELLITTDDPGEDTLEEGDPFHHRHAENTGQSFPKIRRHEELTDVIVDSEVKP